MSEKFNTFISLIIPAYNEEARIVSSLEKAIDFLANKDFSWEILVVDDGSNDSTVEIIKKYSDKVRVICQPKNMGKGAAVRRGMIEAKGEIRLFTDADFSTPIYEMDKVLPILEKGLDICIGNRALDSSMIKEHQPFYREFMGKTFNKIVQLLVFKGITDTQCGFKAFTAQAAIDIFSKAKIDGYGFDVEILYLANLMNYKIQEVPVEWYNDDRSKVNPITDSLKMLKEIATIKRLHKNFSRN